MLDQWDTLERRARTVYEGVSPEYRSAFYQVVYSAILLNHNLNRLYISGEPLARCRCPG